MDCNEIRTQLSLGAEDSGLTTHLAGCPACAAYARREQAFSTALRSELQWQVPIELTARLVALVPGAPPLHVPPKRWYVVLVYVLTILALAVSVAVAWQFYGLLASQPSIAAALELLRAAPAQGLNRLYTALPQSRYAVALLLALRDQLHWVLLALVMWAALDNSRQRTPQAI